MTASDAAAPAPGATASAPDLRECLHLAAESYRTLCADFGAFLKLAWAWIAVGVLAPAILGLVLRAGALAVASFAVWVIAGSAVAIGWHRVLLLGERPGEALRPRLAMLDFATFSGLALVVAFAPAALLSRPLRGLGLYGYALDASVVLFVFFFLLARRLLVFPALAVGGPRASFWRNVGRERVAERQHWAIFAGTLLAAAPAFWLYLMLFAIAVAADMGDGSLSGFVEMALTAAVAVTMPALVAGYSSALYRRIGPGVNPPTALAAGPALPPVGLSECLRLAFASYGELMRKLPAFLTLAMPWLAIDVAARVLIAALGLGATQLATLVLFFAASAVAVGWHRILLLDETPLRSLVPRLAILQVTGLILLAWIIAIPAYSFALVVLGPAVPALADTTGPVAIFAYASLFLLFLARWLLAFPALAVRDRRMRFRQSLRWPAMRERQRWTMLGGALAASLPAIVADYLAIGGGESALARLLLAGLDGALMFVMAALLAGYSSALYRRIRADGNRGTA